MTDKKNADLRERLKKHIERNREHRDLAKQRDAWLAQDALNEIERLSADLAPMVKPLVFGRAEKSGMNLQADCAFGRYYIAARPDGVWLWWRPASGPAHHGPAKSEDDAIQQCQADYERRILSALIPAPITQAQAAKVLLEMDDYMPVLARMAAVKAHSLREGKVRPVTVAEGWRAALKALTEEG